MILNQVHNRMYTTVNGALIPAVISAEIDFLRHLAVPCDVYGMFDQFVNAFLLCRRNRNNRHAEQMFHSVNVYRTAVNPNLVHHVQGNDHRNVQIQQLQRQKQITLDI